MAYRFLKGSTALTVILSLTVPPLPLTAQTGADNADGAMQEVAADEETLRRAEEAQAAAARAAAEAEAAAAQANAAATSAAADNAGPDDDALLRAAEEEAARAAAAAEEAARAAAEAAAAEVEAQAITPPPEPAETQAEPERAEEPAPDAAPAAEAPEPAAPEPETAETPAPDAEPRPEDETLADPAPEAEPRPQDEAVTEAERDGELRPEDETVADPMPEAEPRPEGDTVADPQPGAEPRPEDETVADPMPEAAPLPEDETVADPMPEAEPRPEGETVADPLPEAETRPQDEAVTDPAPGETDTATPPEAIAPEQVLPEAAILGLIAPDAEAPPPAAAGETPDPDAPPVVTTTVVTNEDVRASDEEFEVIPSAAAPTQERASRSSGLTSLEKAALVGIAGLAVGAVLIGGSRVASNSGDRVIIERPDGSYRVLKDDDALLRRPGSTLRAESFGDGSTRTVVLRDDGSEVITVRDASGRVLRRSVIDPFGTETQLFDDTRSYAPVDITTLPRREARMDLMGSGDPESLRLALALAEQQDLGRAFSLQQVREIVDVRELAPEITLDAITFQTASSVVRPEMAVRLREVGLLMRDMIAENPREMFLVEGHTDAVGGAAYNLALSDRRAESVALALTEYFDVPPENLVVQGYGKAHLKVQTQLAEEANRRVAVRRITPLLGWAVATA